MGAQVVGRGAHNDPTALTVAVLPSGAADIMNDSPEPAAPATGEVPSLQAVTAGHAEAAECQDDADRRAPVRRWPKWAEVPTAEVLARSEAARNRAEDAVALAQSRLDHWREARQRARSLSEREQKALMRETTAALRVVAAGHDARTMAAKLAHSADDIATTFDLVADSIEARARHAHDAGGSERWAAARRIRHKADEERREGRRLREQWHLPPPAVAPPPLPGPE